MDTELRDLILGALSIPIAWITLKAIEYTQALKYQRQKRL